jgi:hypothetical protein
MEKQHNDMATCILALAWPHKGGDVLLLPGDDLLLPGDDLLGVEHPLSLAGDVHPILLLLLLHPQSQPLN